jgi:hypothetical protein
MEGAYGAYAAGAQKLQDFVKRYYAIKDAYPANKEVYDEFAASTMPLDKNSLNVGSK